MQKDFVPAFDNLQARWQQEGVNGDINLRTTSYKSIIYNDFVFTNLWGQSLEEYIEKAVNEAEQYAEEDKKRKEEVETRNEAEQVIFQVKKAVEDLGSEATEQEKSDIDAKIADLENALKGNDVEEIKAKKEVAQRAVDKNTTVSKIDELSKNELLNKIQEGEINLDDLKEAVGLDGIDVEGSIDTEVAKKVEEVENILTMIKKI